MLFPKARLRRGIVLFICGMLLTALPRNLYAQGRGQGAVLIDQISQSVEPLNLTAEQKTKIEQILKTGREEARGMMQQLAQADAATRRGRTRELATSLTEKVAAVLTPEQAQQFNAKLRDLRASTPGPLNQQAVAQQIEQLYDVVQRVGLTDEQKQTMESTFTKARQQIRTLRQNPPGDGTMPRRIQEIIQQMRTELAASLTPQQQQRLRDLVAQEEAAPPMAAPTSQPNEMMGGGDMMQGSSREPAPVAATTVDLPEIAGVSPGQDAPAFELSTLDNKSVTLASLKGKVVLLVFGSYSNPEFRQRAAAIEQLRREYGARINVYIVYTRESYAVGQWEVQRNKDEGIAIEQPKDMGARVELAKQAKNALKLTAPILMDSIDDAAAQAYGGFTNAAVLIGRDGTVLSRQKWFEPYALRGHIDSATK